MKRLSLVAIFVLLLSGCATLFAPPPPAGTPVEAVIARYGQPAMIYQVGKIKVLEWPTHEDSQYAFMAQVDAHGKLIWYGNVRTTEQFSKVIVNQFNKNDVLVTLGHPSETEYLTLKKQEVWSYRFREEGMWDSIMHFYFNGNGIVCNMEKTQDTRFEENQAFSFGRFGRRRR